MSSSKKPKTSRRPEGASGAPDPRFASIGTDPRYRLPSTKNARVGVDKRFSRMFKDEDFSRKAKVDRYGRKVEKGSDKKDLQRLYKDVDDEEDEDEDDSEKEDSVPAKGKPARRKQIDIASASEDEDEADEDGQVEAELQRIEGRRDPAREGFSSSEDDSSSEEEDELEDDEAELAEGGQAEVPMGEVSSRLAVVNLDWDNIRAADLMAVAQSFVPTGGSIVNVTIYPSEFGKERIEQEELEGPPREIFASSSRPQEDVSEEEDSDEEEAKIRKRLQGEDKGEEFDSGKLRQYQLDRLRYYYAVITCDSAPTAKAIYDDMDSREYLTSANFFDLRFIPDEVNFDSDKPRDECKHLPAGYKPNEFVTEALTHSKVRLTWDDDDTTRKEVQKRAFSRAEIDENDLQAYIGSESSEDEADEAKDTAISKAETQREKMRTALGLSLSSSKTSKSQKSKQESGPVGDMQITFSSGLSGSSKPLGTTGGSGVFENEPLIPGETTKEAYIRKEKARKAARREKAKAARAGTLAEHGLGDASPSPEPEHDRELIIKTAPADSTDPFDDPFFNDAPAAQKAERTARKADRLKKRNERLEAEKVSAGQRKELELLMVEDRKDDMRHFNMDEIRKAEKEKKRKGKKGKQDMVTGDGEGEGEGVVEDLGFKMQTQDPRFARLFESHEYAIDPTNPRYKGTEGMKALLEEGRKKRKAPREDVPDEGVESRQKKSKKMDAESHQDDGQDLQKLVARVKAKTKNKKV